VQTRTLGRRAGPGFRLERGGGERIGLEDGLGSLIEEPDQGRPRRPQVLSGVSGRRQKAAMNGPEQNGASGLPVPRHHGFPARPE
jgi:hypothetical protein